MPWFGEDFLPPSKFVAPDPEDVMSRLGLVTLASPAA
jgi:hypothetical protein